MVDIAKSLSSMRAATGLNSRAGADFGKNEVKGNSPAPNATEARETSRVQAKAKTPGKRFADELNEREVTAKPAAKETPIATARPTDNNEVRETAQGESNEADVNEALNSLRKGKPATRQAAMEAFLARMQNDLGISAGDVLEAFAQLSQEDLSATPEASAKAFIAQLGLGDQESEKATSLYNEMLAMSAAGGLAQSLAQNGQTAEVQVLSREEARLRDLRSSLGTMSDKFFMTGGFAPANTGIDRQEKISQAYGAQAALFKDQKDTAVPVTAASAEASALAQMGADTQVGSGAMDISGMSEVSTANADLGMDLGSALSSSSVDTAGATQESAAAASAQDSSLAALKSQNPLNASSTLDIDGSAENLSLKNNSTLSTPGLEAHTNPVVVGSGASADTGAFGEDTEQKDENLTDAQGEPRLGERLNSNPIQAKSAFTLDATAAKATAADVQANVKEVISQAQFLAGKGGGEVKVVLNPEGLGEVSLKVKTVDGQVNVEMVTASDEAKKVLEKGLSELKDSLASHKLNLDSIKIEHTKDISRHMDQQQRDFEQGFQQKFLNDFRERNGGYKREMFELGAASAPSSQTRDRAMNATYDPTRNKRRPDGSSRRLDLVA